MRWIIASLRNIKNEVLNKNKNANVNFKINFNSKVRLRFDTFNGIFTNK